MHASSSALTRKREMLSRDVRIQSILEARQRMFSNRPYDEVSIDDIAAEAAMSKGLLYHYFGSKRELYLETLRSVFARMTQITEEYHDLRACLNAFLSCFEQSPDLARMVFRGGIGSDAEAEALLSAYRQHQFRIFFRHMGGNTLDPVVQLGLRSWISFFQEVCLQWLEQRDIPRERVIVLLEHSLQAILSCPEQERHASQRE